LPGLVKARSGRISYRMPRGYLNLDTPIAALATAPGASALAVIRTSGPGTLELLAPAFSRPDALRKASGNTALHGFVRDPETGRDLDEVVAVVFRAPAGYTGQDSVDLMCHGSPAALEGILAALEKRGFARALPGEFTFRAFAAGKMDLSACEAVDELVRSRTQEARAGAMERLAGGLRREVLSLRDSVLAALSEVEARLDYGEDELPDSPEDIHAAVSAALSEAERLAASHSVGRILAEGARVALAGRTNAGKSRLFNLFLKEERSIVSAAPGTTRDYIEASLDLGGLPVTLYDTAGLREAVDPVEAEGVRRSRLLAEGADLVVYLVDGTEGTKPEDLEILGSLPGALRVWNKRDRPEALPPPEGWLSLSAVSGEGFPELTAALAVRLRGDADASGGGRPRIAGQRQADCADRAARSLRSASEALAAELPLDALAVDLKDAADALAELTGESVPESVLEAIFSRFCVGK
jgi:tRNA modification GTPase